MEGIFGGFLKQSTSVKQLIGPFVDATDGFTPETGITLGAADQAEAWKHDASSTTDISGNTWSHIADGMYNLTLTTSDTNTVGTLGVIVVDTSVCRPVRVNFMVLTANIYDSLVGGGAVDYLDVNVKQVSEDTTAADLLEAGADCIVTLTVGSGSSTSVIATDLTETTNDHYNGRTITFRSGALAGQSSQITDYSGTTKEITCSTLTEAPSNGDTAIIS